ncbi:NAD(P)H-binding protein [Bradyrhizobium sp. 186]|uniref:NAD(P)H-binding protein n=1 Tax=Bradyrhizobium sp. 186 TaxID=2782654 RepID=UPI00200186FD|nr:NAD(P)H-binding protein [Bradyrhizobium sp. 186]UPK40279.1 NAD(P)H-binding protein [Bradyrhizobium sp. 186]
MHRVIDRVIVFGGTGFVGRRIVRRLSDAGATVPVASRHPAQDGGDNLEQVVADAHDERSVEAAVAGADGVVNAISLYVEHGADTFHSVHVKAAARIARVARQAGVKRFVHVSGIGADTLSPSPYIRTRGEGEAAVQAAFSGAIVVRPAVIFARDDAFLTAILGLAPLASSRAQISSSRARSRLGCSCRKTYRCWPRVGPRQLK